MDGVFDWLGLAGVRPELQWLVLIWGLIAGVTLLVELVFWLALKRSANVTRLGAVRAPATTVTPSFVGENVAKKEQHLARGDAYAGPEHLRAAEASPAAVRRRFGAWRRLLLWLVILCAGAVGAWFFFGDPMTGLEIEGALEPVLEGGGAGRGLAPYWFFLVLTAGRIAIWLAELRYSS